MQATVGDSMYYLASGKASVIVDGRVIGLVQPGELFGVEPFMCSVRSLVVDDTDPKKDNIMMMLGFVSSDGVQHSYCPDRGMIFFLNFLCSIPCSCIHGLPLTLLVNSCSGDYYGCCGQSRHRV